MLLVRYEKKRNEKEMKHLAYSVLRCPDGPTTASSHSDVAKPERRAPDNRSKEKKPDLVNLKLSWSTAVLLSLFRSSRMLCSLIPV